MNLNEPVRTRSVAGEWSGQGETRKWLHAVRTASGTAEPPSSATNCSAVGMISASESIPVASRGHSKAVSLSNLFKHPTTPHASGARISEDAVGKMPGIQTCFTCS